MICLLCVGRGVYGVNQWCDTPLLAYPCVQVACIEIETQHGAVIEHVSLRHTECSVPRVLVHLFVCSAYEVAVP
jgi:hypothetical protein